MINNDALESSNNYSLIVTKRNRYNVEALGNASATSPLELSSWTRFFLHKGKRSSPFSSAGDTYSPLSSNRDRVTTKQTNANVTNDELAAGIR